MSGRCLHCGLDVGCDQPEDDAWASNRGPIAVNSEGYAIDYEDYFGEPASAITQALMAADCPGQDDDDDADGGKKKKGGKKSKHDKTGSHNKRGAADSQHGERASKEDKDAALRANVVGFTNLGNTCFFNATMQALARCHGLAETCTLLALTGEVQGALSKAFVHLMAAIASGDNGGKTISPNGLFHQLCRHNVMFREMGQQDAQELLNCVANGVDAEQKLAWERRHQRRGDEDASEASSSSALFARHIGATLVNSFVCHACGTRRSVREHTYDFSAPVTHSVASSLAAFMASEVLDGENAYACESCHRDAFQAEERRRAAEASMRALRARELAAADPTGAGVAAITVVDDSDGDDDGSSDGSDGTYSGEDEAAEDAEATENDVARASPDAAAEVADAGARGAQDNGSGHSMASAPVGNTAPAITPAAAPAQAARGGGVRHGAATLEHALAKPADVLVVHLKRFSVNMRTYTWEKMAGRCHIDEHIDIGAYLSPPDLAEKYPHAGSALIRHCLDAAAGDVAVADGLLAEAGAVAAVPEGRRSSSLYRLVAIVEHQGSIDSGHYVAYVRTKAAGWFYCSDHVVRPVDAGRALAAQAYMVFYERVA